MKINQYGEAIPDGSWPFYDYEPMARFNVPNGGSRRDPVYVTHLKLTPFSEIFNAIPIKKS